MEGWTFLGTIYTKKSTPDALIAHEQVHVAQQARDGVLFYLRYVFSRWWRTRYEAEGYAVNVERGIDTVDSAASLLSSSLYLWPCSFDEAKDQIMLALDARRK